MPESSAFCSGDWSELKEVREDNCLRVSLKDNATKEERRVLVCDEKLEYVSAESTRLNGVISMDAICAASVLIAGCSADWLMASMVAPSVCALRTVGPDEDVMSGTTGARSGSGAEIACPGSLSRLVGSVFYRPRE